MNREILNITNGDCFNEYFISQYGGVAIPFCEAMMDGDVVANVYSEEFVVIRAKSLNIAEDEYREKMYVYDALNNKNYQIIHLWFGKDTFCQINLLTLLAYLEQIEFRGELKLNYIDDEKYEILESNLDVKLGTYNKIYKDVLIFKNVPDDVGVLSVRAINLFFDYHSDNGELAKLVRANANIKKMDLICLLMERSKDYGLSDLQAEKLINSNSQTVRKT